MNLLCKFRKCRDVALGIIARVQALLSHAPVFQRPFAGLIQSDNIGTAQSEVGSKGCALFVTLPFDRDTHNPAPRTGRINNQVKPAAIPVPPGPQILDQLLC